MPNEPISPELVLVDPELGARARAALPDVVTAPIHVSPPRRASAPTPTPPLPQAAPPRLRPYPLWARVTAALWILVLGILIGGAAIPHAQDQPRVILPDEDPSAVICKRPVETPVSPPTLVDPVNPGGRTP